MCGDKETISTDRHLLRLLVSMLVKLEKRLSVV